MPDPSKAHHPDTIKRAATLGVSGPRVPLGIDDVKPDPTVGLTFVPTGRRLLVRRVDTDEVLSEGGIVKPAVAHKPFHVGEVVDLGSKLAMEGFVADRTAEWVSRRANRLPNTPADPITMDQLASLAKIFGNVNPSVGIGWLVMYAPHTGVTVEVNGKKLRLLMDTDVMGCWPVVEVEE